MKRYWLRRGLRFFAFALLFIGLAGLVTMSLWNALLPSILGVSAISFGQALGLLALSRILFGGFRGPWGRPGFGSADYGNTGRGQWKRKMTERWQNLTPEQRESMRQKWGDRCGRGWSDRRAGRSAPPTPEGPPPADDPTTVI